MSYLEKRREPRQAASGRLLIRAVEPANAPLVPGRLLDLSLHGFRAAHLCHNLMPGQEVDFEHDSAAGRARVVWNRILAGEVETGFFILLS